MLNFVATAGLIFKHFALRFSDIFSKRLFVSFYIYLATLMMEHRRISIRSPTQKNLLRPYDHLQYFLSDAKWDPQILNSRRVEMLQSHCSTKSTSHGILAINDSGCKKYGKKTETAKVQYYGTEGRLENCNVMVASAYCDHNKR